MSERLVVERAADLVALWRAQKISGVPRAERNAAIEDVRSGLCAAVDAIDIDALPNREWQPIETAPTDGSRVMLWLDRLGAVIGYYSTRSPNGWIYYTGIATGRERMEREITHWQPLPLGPNQIASRRNSEAKRRVVGMI